MTKLQHNQTFKLAVILAVGIAVFMGAISVNGNNLLPKNNTILSQLQENKPANDDTNGLICPEDISTYTDINSCSSVISSGLDLEDPEGILKQLSWHMTGATEGSSGNNGMNQIGSYSFNEGTTVISYNGTDVYNKPVFCTFSVTITDNQVPKFVNPLKTITVAAKKGDCGAEVIWSVPRVIDNCNSFQQIHIICSHESGSWFPVGETNVTYTLDDGVEGEYTFSILVVDNEIPVFVAPNRNNVVFGNAVPEAFTSYQEFERAGGIASDNCAIDAKSFRFIRETRTGTVSPFTVTRTYQIADENGNITKVDHHIQVERETIGLKSGQTDLTASSGNWSNTATWGGGALPTSGDNVTIPTGVTVTVDITTAVCNNITVQSGGTLIISGSNALSVYGDWSNSGTFTPGTDGTVVFTGTSDATISGTTTFENLQVTKGSISTTLNITGDVTVSSGGLLTINSGLVAIASGGSLDLAYSSGLTIPSIAGFEVNGGTLSTGNFTVTNNGLIRVNSGTATFGINSGNTVHTQNTGAFIVSNGTVNIAGRLESTADGILNPPGVNSGITISGGTVTLSTAGNNLSGVGSLNVSSSGDFYFTGGTIVFQYPSTASTELDLGLIDGTGTKNISGGTFQFGNASTSSGSVFVLDTDLPLSNVTSSANADLFLNSDLVITGTLSLDANTSIELNGNSLIKEISSGGTYSFPIADGSGNPVTVSITISGTFGGNASIEVTTTDNDHPNNVSSSNYLNQYWTITLNDISNPNYSISAQYQNSDIIGSESEIAMGIWYGSLPWDKYGAVISGSNTLTASGITASTIDFTGITLDAPTVIINGGNASETICDGSSVTLTAVPTGDPGWTYSWNPTSGLSASDIASPSASPSTTTTYTVTVTDGNGFTATDDIQVIVDPIPDVVATPNSEVICSGTATGISFSGSVSGTTFSWTVSQSGASGASAGSGNSISQMLTTTGSASGTVTYTVTPSANGCDGTPLDVVVTVHPIPNVVATPGSETVCSGNAPNINFTSSVSGTTFNWTVSQSGASGASAGSGSSISQPLTATGSSSGTVIYTVTPSSNGCDGTPVDVVVTVNPIPNVVATPGSETICSGNAPNINLTSTVAGTSFNWTVSQSGASGASAGSGNSISQILMTTGSSSGTITYTVTPSANGCDGTPVDVVVTVNPVPNVVATPASETVCSGNASNISLSGSVAGTTFSWIVNQSGATGASAGSGTTISHTLTATGSSTGTVTYTVTPSANGCNGIPVDIVVTVYPPLTPPTISSAQNICYNTTPQALVGTAATGGSGSYTYQWQSSPNGTDSWTNVGTNNLVYTPPVLTSTTFYQLVVTDLCGTEYSNVIEINVAPELTASGAATAILCNGGSSTVTLSANGGTPPYEYTFNGVPDADGIISNVTAGTYNWSVTDARNCGPVSGTIDITEPTLVTATIAITDQIDCNGQTGEVAITASGGTTPYEYTFNGVTQSSNVFTGILAGINLTWSVRDANGCEFIAGAPVDMIAPDVLTATAVATDVLCNGGNTGSIELTVTGGTTPYTFAWNNGAGTGEDPSGLVANTYTVVVSDANGCSISTSATVDEPAALSASIDATSILCYGETSDIQINVGGGTPPYLYTFDGVSNGTGTFTGISAANGIVWQVEDANGCIFSDTYDVVEPTDIVITDISATDTEICEGENIELSSSATGGTGTLRYNWTGPNGYTANNAQNPTILSADVLFNGTYTLTVTDANNCSKNTSIDITVHPSPTVNPIADIEDCHDVSISAITITGSNADDFSWTIDIDSIWTNGASGTGNIPAFTTNNGGNTPVTATVTVTPLYTGQGCSGVPETFTITVNPEPVLTITNNTPILCDNGITSIVLSSNVSGTTFNWSGNDGSSGTSSIIEENISGNVTYTITPTANGCNGESFTTDVLVISTSYDLEVNPTSSPAPNYCQGEDFSINFRASSSGSGSGNTGGWRRTEYQWFTQFMWTVDNPNVVAITSGGPIGNGTVSNPDALTNLTLPLINTTNVVQTATISITPWSYYRERSCFFIWCDPWPSSWTQQCAGDAYEITITVQPFAIECPADITVDTDPGECDATLIPAAPTITCDPGSNLTWSMTGATTDSGSGNISSYDFPSGTTTVTYRATESGVPSNYRECSFNVIVTDNEAPVVANCQADINQTMSSVVCGDTVTFTDPTFTDNCDGVLVATRTDGTGLNSGDVFPVGTTTLTWYAVDAAGNDTTCSFDVTILPDGSGPDIACVGNQAECAPYGGTYLKTGTDWNASASDNCPGVISLTYNLIGATSGTGSSLNNVHFNVGTTTVEWTATDINGNSSVCSFDVVVEEVPGMVLDPLDVSTCLNGTATFTASAEGTAALSYQWRFNGTDIPLATDTFLTITNVQASDAGNYDVVVTNSCGIVTSTSAALTVSSPPVISTQPASQTDCEGESVMFTVAVSGGEAPYVYVWEMRPTSTDAWVSATTVGNIAVTDNLMTVSNIGDMNNPNQAQYRVIVADFCGNQDTSTVATLTVNQVVVPAIIDSVTVCQDGAATFSVLTSGSIPVSYQWQQEGVSISDNAVFSGTTTQTLTITDAQVSENGTYSVLVTFNITQPNNNGAGVTTCVSSSVDIGELIVDEGPDIDADIPAQTICPGDAIAEITLSNLNGTPGTTYSWTRDNTGVLTGMPASGAGNTINGTLNSLTPGSMVTTTFTITATTPNSCFSTSTLTVTVGDTIAPTITTCPADIIVSTDPVSCDATVTYSTPTFDDNCDGAGLTGTLSEGLAPGSTFPVGTTSLKYVYTDAAGNVSDTCFIDVTVEDNENPTALCQNITLQLDAAGSASITPSDIDNASFDGCGLDSLRIDISSFDCTDIGPIMVTLTAVDLSGNEASCIATVTVADTISPTAVCRDITVYLDGSGAATISGADIDNGSSDNCGINTMTASMTSFDCTHIGSPQTVTLTIDDVNGNIGSCNAVVTVADTLPPTAICRDITVQLDATGSATITANDINNGSIDNCGINTMYISENSFDCTNVGSNTVTLTVEDVYGNSANCNTTVTVEDTEKPVAICRDITIQLDAAGLASIVAADVDNGSTDNCGVPTLSVTPNNFNCTNLGANIVTLTATDTYGNDSICQAIVTVSDDNFPVNITATVSQTEIFCNGELADVTISVIGGVGTLTYTFNGNSQATNTFSGIAAGTYTWSVEDPFSCGDTSGTFEVVEPDAITASIDASDVDCSTGNDGVIRIINNQGGSGDYEFTIDGWTTSQADSVFPGLSPGIYNVQMRDANATWCVAVLDAALEIIILSADVTSTDISCYGLNEGTITVSNPDGGSGNYQYTIDGGTNWTPATTGDFTYSNLPADTFDVRVRDANDITCVIPLDTALIIIQPDSLFADLDSTNITCFGAGNGTISLTNPAGGSGTYEYTVNGGVSWENTGDYNSLAPGTYDVRIRDANNPSCERTLDGALVLTEPPVMTATVDSSNISCNGFNDGEIIILNPTGGYGTYEFSIDGGTSWQDSISFLNLYAGIYDVRMRDLADTTCEMSLDPALELSEPPAMTIASQPTDITDCYGTTVSFGVLPNGGAGTISYEWQYMRPAESVFTTIAGQVSDSLHVANIGDANSPNGTQYRVIVSDNCSSLISDTVTLTVNEIVFVSPDTLDKEICEGQDYSLQVTTSGETPTNYQWQIDTTGSWVNLANNSIISGVNTDQLTITGASPSETGQYRVVVTFPSSGIGCDLSSESFVRNLTVHPLPLVDTTTDMVVCNGNMVPQITFTGTATSYDWINSNTGIGLAASGTGDISTFLAVNNDTVPVSASIVVTPRGLYCDGLPDTFNITINPTPEVIPPVNVIFCDGFLSDPYPLTGIPAATVFNITGGASIGLADVTNVSEIPSFLPIAGTATLTVTPVYEGCAGTPETFNVLVVESPTATITGGDTVCQGALAASLIFQSTSDYPVQATYTVNDIDTNVVTIPFATPVQVPVPTNVPGDFDYVLISVRYISEPFCSNPDVRDTARVTVIEPPVPTISGPSSICALTGGHIYTTEPGMTNYVWNISAGGTITAGGNATSDSVIVTWNTSGNKNVSVRYTDNNACSATLPTIFPVTVYAVPVPTITGAGNVCEDEVVVYTTQSGMTNYTWMVAGGTITAGGGSGNNTVTVAWDTAGVQNISVNYENANGCVADSATLSITQRNITVNPEPEPSLAGVDTACTGTEHIYTTEPGMSSYVWTVSAGGNIVSGGTFSDNTATVRWNVDGSQSVSVNYTDLSGCVASVDSTLQVTVHQSPDPTITGPDIICSGSSNSIYRTESGMTGYQWVIVSGDGTITSGANDSVVYITWNSVGSHTISVDYTNENNCNAITPTELEVVAVDEVVPTITGVQSVCEGTTGSYSTESGMLSYNWVVVGGTITAGGGSASNSATILWDSAGVQTVSVDYLSINGCNSIVTDHNVTVDPMPHPTISGSTSVCLDTILYTYTTEPGMTNYQWIYSAGAIVIGGGTSTDDYIDIQWNVLGTQSVSVNYTNPNGCRATSASIQNVVVNELTPVTCPPDTTFCVNVSPVTLVEGSPAGGTFSGTGVTGNIFDPAAAGVGMHTIAYMYTNDSSCVSTCFFNIRVDPQPIAADQYITICSGSELNFNLNDVVPDADFVWTAYDNSSGTSVSGFNDCLTSCDTLITDILINSSAADPGSSNGTAGTVVYQVTATHNGCGGTFDLVVTVEPDAETFYLTWNSNFVEDFIEVCAGAEALSDNDIEILDASDNLVGYSRLPASWNPTFLYGPTSEGPWTTAPGYNNYTSYYQWVVDFSVNDRLGYHYFIVEITDPNTGCIKISEPAILNIVSSLVVEADGPDFLCSSSAPTAHTLTGAYVGGLISSPPVRGSWSITGINPANGGNNGSLSSTSATTDPANVTYTLPANYVGEVTLTLTSSDPDGSGECVPLKDTRTINVLPQNSFEGCLDPLEWTQSGSSGNNGYIDDGESPCLTTVVGSDNGTGSYGIFGISHCSGDGYLTFDWYFKAPPEEIIWHQEDQQEGYNSGSSMIVSAPSNLSAGDLIIVTIHVNDNTTVTSLPSGFSAVSANGSSTNGNVTVASFYKIADGTEGTLTFGTTGNVSSNDRIYSSRVTGHNQSNPIGNSAGVQAYLTYPAEGYMNITMPSVNAGSANSMLVSALAIEISGTSSDDVEFINSPLGSATMYYEDYETTARVAKELLSSAGATGTRTFSWPSYNSRNRRNMYVGAQMFLINPATPDVDAAYYLVGGIPVLLGNQDGDNGTISVPVTAGEEIAFAVETQKNTGGPGELIIYNLDVPNDPPVVSGDTLIEYAECQLAGFDPDTAFTGPAVFDDCDTFSIQTGYPTTTAIISNGCENSQIRTWVYVDDCGQESEAFSQRVVWTIIDPIQLTCPPSDTLGACTDPADVEAAYNIWAAGFLSPTGGCGTVTDNLNELPVYTDLSCGGQISFTLMVSDDCGQVDSCTSHFVINAAEDLSITCPADTLLPACTDTADIRLAYEQWISEFTHAGGCSTVTTNIDSIPALPDLSCGGEIEFRYVVNLGSPSCPNSIDCYATFGVETPVDLEVVVSPDASLPLCSDTASIRAAYNTWVAGFLTSGGCDVQTNIDSVPALPDLTCGGSISFVFRARNGADKCVDSAVDSSSFEVFAPPPLVLTCPSDPNLPGCAGAIAITNAYNNWIDSFRVSGACDVTTNIDSIPPLGDLLCDGQLSFTFIATSGGDVCYQTDTCTSTFTIGGADNLVVSCPPDTTVIGCSAAEVQNIFDAWIDSFTYTGGCNVSASDLTIYTPPVTCGGTLRVDFVVSDECGQADSCSAEFTVEAPPLSIQVPKDTLLDACSNQLDVDIAFASWISGFGHTGGCNVLVTDTSLFFPPDICGGEIIVNYSASDACGQVKNGSAFFAIDIPKNVELNPSFTVPANTTAYTDAVCVADTSPSATGWPTDLYDNCTQDSLVITYTDSVVPGLCTGAYVVYRFWTVTDNCLNDTTQLQVIDVTDTIPPLIVCPADASEYTDPSQCYKTGMDMGIATATDNCTPQASIVITNDAPVQLPVGTTVVTWTATDDCGNVSSCTQLVTIVDTIPPNIDINGCQDVTETAAPNNCSKVPDTMLDPVYLDDCWPLDSLVLTYTVTGATIASGTGSAAVVDYNVGVSYVTYVVTDPDGLQDSCSFTVTIVDVTPPGINIGGCVDVSDTAAANNCSKIPATIADPTYSDDCWPVDSLVLTWTMTGATTGAGNGSVAGETFNVGLTTVQYVVTDPDGNSDSCSFTVRIIDITAPGIDIGGCVDVSGTMDASNCYAIPPAITDPTFSDACWPLDSLVLSFRIENGAWDTTGLGYVSGLLFPVGTNTVWYIVTDPDGNADSCSFTVEMLRDEIQWTAITCPPGYVSATLGPTSCDTLLTLPPPAVSDFCVTATYTITNDYNGLSTITNEAFVAGITEVNWTISDNSGNDTTCTVYVEVDGIQLPSITCPPNVSGTMDASDCYAIPPVIDPPVYSAPCWDTDSLDLSFRIENGAWDTTGVGEVNGLNLPVGTNTVWYIITDPDGNADSCSFTVEMFRDEIQWTAITCPSDPAPIVLGPTECERAISLDPPTVSDYCVTATYTITNDFNGLSTITNELFPTGITEVNWTISDNSGNDSICTVYVDISGVQLPTIACPPNVVQQLTADQCEAIPVSIQEPDVDAPCWPDDSLAISYVITGALDSVGNGSVSSIEFPFGISTVTYTVTDPDGNSADCSFTVSMSRPTIPPAVVNCPPGSVTVTVNPNECETFVDLDPPTVTDPCLTAVYTITNDYTGTNNADTLYPIGFTTVTWTVRDTFGNEEYCTVVVEVIDLPPTLICPPDTVIQADFNQSYASDITIALPYFEDNCDSTLTWTVSGVTTFAELENDVLVPGINVVHYPDTFNLGTTTITYTFVDGHGNSVECSHKITVLGSPDIECPPDTTIYLDGSEGTCEATFDPGVADLIQGTPPITWTYTITFPDGSTQTDTYIKDAPDPEPNPLGVMTFPLGVTTIEWRAENISGFDTCSHWIEVIDTIPPTFDADPYENCVDPLHWAVYNESNPNPVFNHVDPLVEKFPVDYRTLFAGDTFLDLTSLEDNCCDSVDMTINWRIEFSDTPDPVTGVATPHPDVSGQGQPSEYVHPVTGLPTDIELWGDGVLFTTVTHNIFYWVEDCNGNTSDELMQEITITPRPEVTKQNY
ncbi:HYR domain-containing protein [uncultured Draconibacterium sp.]|uniref:HYR domain-containing protein n=1 Tax=uncultured Draconibacterium sp. TaxID=1573823 RepID=UPI0032172CC0